MIYRNLLVIFTFLFLCRFESSALADGICLPRAKSYGSQGWPICAIYMHGLFGLPDYPESKWEIPFRDSLEKISVRKHCKIAVPFGNPGKHWNWNGVRIAEVRSRAEKACVGSKFIEKPDIIGFSNGANVLRGNTCQTLSQFYKVTLIGPTGLNGNDKMKDCGNVHIHQRHEVPKFEELEHAITYSESQQRSDSGPSGAVSLK